MCKIIGQQLLDLILLLVYRPGGTVGLQTWCYCWSTDLVLLLVYRPGGTVGLQTWCYCCAVTGQFKQWPHGETPLDFLENASHCYACAIKGKPKDAALHMKLGQVLEERYYAEDLFGLKKEVSYRSHYK